jgi:hypothetical protein
MKTIKLYLIIATLFVFIPAIAMAGGGIEPGEGCPAPEDVRLKYVPPPFMGDATLRFDEAGTSISVNGVLSQAGNPDCELTIIANPYRQDVLRENWDNMKPNDLRQRCLEEIQFIVGGNCDLEYQLLTFYEAVAAGNIRDVDADTKTVRFVVMGLE